MKFINWAPGTEANAENAWLGLGDVRNMDIPHNHLLDPVYTLPSDDPGLYEISLMSRPEYLGLACKELLNITLHPFQAVVLEELWRRPFPMLLASRGAGKCQTLNSKIITKDGIKTLSEFVDDDIEKKIYHDNLYVLGENGFSRVEYSWKNQYQDTLKLTTRCGFILEGVPNHKIRGLTPSSQNIEWLELNHINIDDYVIIDRDNNNTWAYTANDIPKDLAYFFGCIVGDGGYTVRGRISFTTAEADYFIPVLNQIVNKYWGLEFKINASDKYGWNLYSTALWDKLFTQYGFNSSVCAEKDIPKCIYAANKDAVAAFMSGLFDTDGSAPINGHEISCSSKSFNLMSNVQFLLSRFGIIANLRTKYNKKYDRNYYELVISGDNIKLFNQSIGFKLPRKNAIAISKESKNNNPNIDTIPSSLIANQIRFLYQNLDSNIKSALSPNVYKLFSQSRLDAYNISYYTLERILDYTSSLQESQEWKYLNNIYTKKYFFDKIVKIEKSQNYTADLHIPHDHTYIADGFISHNTFMLGVYAVLRSFFFSDYKIVAAGASFRQSKAVLLYAEKIWNEAPILRSLCSERSGIRKDIDRWTLYINGSEVIGIPIGIGGEKIRGLRAQTVLADEFASHDPDIYETVISGFGAVEQAPIVNVRAEARKHHLQKLGLWDEELQRISELTKVTNQNIITGTASYYGNHFFDYFIKYRDIVRSKGEEKALNEIFPEGVPPKFNYKHYSIIRLPYELLPQGFMSEEIVSRAKATINTTTYRQEFSCVFQKDSDGFFKRSLIDSRIATQRNISSGKIPAWCSSPFDPKLFGNENFRYVMGVDPASESDNLAITILEIRPEHRRLVYCWTINKKRFKERVSAGLIQETDYYQYCARKIRELMHSFNIHRIVIDAQGGGIAIEEALQRADTLQPGEDRLWRVKDDDNPQDSDLYPGQHIIVMFQPARADDVSEANHGLRQDLERGILLFPRFDPVTIELSIVEDKIRSDVYAKQHSGKTLTLYDTLEDCVMDIEELKNELTTIQMTRTGSGINSREKWSTPEKKISGSKKSHMKKDRYSALLMANFIARQLESDLPVVNIQSMGGLVQDFKKTDGPMYTGPSWFTDNANTDYYIDRVYSTGD